MARKVPVICIVGRTNVGKSSLFNALTATKSSIVQDEPGVTRDRHYGMVNRYSAPFTIVDTGGLIGEDNENLQKLVKAQAELAIEESDLVVAVFDGLYGPHPHDSIVVDLLRRAGKPVVWVVNKCEKPLSELESSEFFSLGVDDLVPVSAAHRVGIDDLAENIIDLVGATPAPLEEDAPPAEEEIRVAIIGKPNAGKSTLVNRILGEERLVTSEIAGTTRDAVDIKLTRDGKQFVLVDTAGLRRKRGVEDDTVERYANLRALRALANCDVAMLVLDATEGPPTDQDVRIAGLAHERGRGLVVVVNKWDAVEKDHTSVKAFERAIYERLKFARYAPILFVSALSGRRCPSVLSTALEVLDRGRLRVKTSDLNRVFERAFAGKPPPTYRGEPIKLFFATQVDVNPPSFVLFVNYPARINFSYTRYLRNIIRSEFPFEGTDIRLIFRKRTEKGDRQINERGGRAAAR